jgi:hypothetical protein
MKINKGLRILIIYMLITIALGMLFSCSSIKKLRSNVKQSSKIDSTHQQKSSIDSTGSNTVTRTDSSGVSIEVEYPDGVDTSDVDLDITIYKPSADDYDQVKIGVKSNKQPKGVKVNDTRKKSEASSNTISVKRDDEKKTVVKKEEQKTEKKTEKKKLVFHWWYLLLLIPVALYILYKKYPVPFRKILSKFI